MSDVKMLCPECRQQVSHDRGYLVEHDVQVGRTAGAGWTRAQICNGSSRKIPHLDREVKFTGMCPDCENPVTVILHERFPGDLAQSGGLFYADCPVCTVVADGDYCEYCGVDLHDEHTGTAPTEVDEALREFRQLTGQTPSLVDATDGDTCSGNDLGANENLPHVPVHKQAHEAKVLMHDGFTINEKEEN